jgi:hypothetical protein
VPGPAEVQHQAVQRGQRLGQGYADGEPANRFHGQTLMGLRHRDEPFSGHDGSIHHVTEEIKIKIYRTRWPFYGLARFVYPLGGAKELGVPALA